MPSKRGPAMSDITPLIAPRDELNFYHQKACHVRHDMSAFQAYCVMTQHNSFLLKGAFWLRDRLSRLGKVKPIHGFSSIKPEQPPHVGDTLDFFTVHTVSHYRLCLTSIDSHLGVMVAIEIADNTDTSKPNELMITTSVKTYNAFGTLYMLPVAPAHGLIINNMLRKLPV